MLRILLALSICFAAPAAAQGVQDFTYDVDFIVASQADPADPITITGTIVTSCNSCTVSLLYDPIVSWSFTASNGVSISSATGGVIQGFDAPPPYDPMWYPVTVTPTAIVYSPQESSIQQSQSSELAFIGNNVSGDQVDIETDHNGYDITFDGDNIVESVPLGGTAPPIEIATLDVPQGLPAPTIGEGLPGLVVSAVLILLWRRRALPRFVS